jgi:hypothetical protein
MKEPSEVVYVDEAVWSFGRMKMCHMMSRNLDRLHEMADRIGVNKKHFQNGRHPHYDICKSKRELAIRLGAVPVSSIEMMRLAGGMKGEPKPWKKPNTCRTRRRNE